MLHFHRHTGLHRMGAMTTSSFLLSNLFQVPIEKRRASANLRRIFNLVVLWSVCSSGQSWNRSILFISSEGIILQSFDSIDRLSSFPCPYNCRVHTQQCNILFLLTFHTRSNFAPQINKIIIETIVALRGALKKEDQVFHRVNYWRRWIAKSVIKATNVSELLIYYISGLVFLDIGACVCLNVAKKHGRHPSRPL
jgi:hypothetical protein